MAGYPNAKEGLRAVLDHRLAFLVAASESGKTALLHRWASEGSKEQGLRIAYLGLGSEDNCADKFCEGMLLALRDAGLKFNRCLATEHGNHEAWNLEEDLIDLINAVDESAEDCILILDNYEVIDADCIHAAVEFLLDFLPEKMHVIIAGQEEPPLRLAKLRVRRQLLVLQIDDLIG